MADRPRREKDQLKLPTVQVGGRFFTKYDPQIALDIVARIADGELLAKITAKDATPLTVTKQTFLRWVATVPELSLAYAAAMRISAHSFEEMALDRAQRIADNPGSPANVSAASLYVNQLRWSAARRDPRYSDKGTTNIIVPVQINTTLDMGKSDGQNEVEVPDIYTIKLPEKIEDGVFEEVEPEDSDEEKEPIVTPKTADTISKDDFRALLRPDVPFKGVSRQPLLQTGKKRGQKPGIPHKRVLTPRTKS